jgi:iron-sulfur cluster assembly protein
VSWRRGSILGIVADSCDRQRKEKHVLTITENAGLVVSDIVSRAVTTDTGGLRIVEAADDKFAVSVADGPTEAEVVTEQAGARVFMDAPVAAVLADKVLDARVDEDGAVQFLIAVQPS